MTEEIKDPAGNVAPPRVSVPFTPEQTIEFLKLHRHLLVVKLAKTEAADSETKAVTALNVFVNNLPKPGEGNWTVNPDTFTIDPV
jgi:hypothetical protein